MVFKEDGPSGEQTAKVGQCGFASVLSEDRYSTLWSEVHGEQQVCTPVQGVVDLGPGQVAVVVRKRNGVGVGGRKCSGKFS